MLTVDKEKRPDSKTILEKLEKLSITDLNNEDSKATLNVNTMQ
jgi:hypothetical protein